MANSLNINESEIEKIVEKISDINTFTVNKNDFLIMHINIRSICGNILHLCTLLDNLLIKPDILVCTEAWLTTCYGFIDLSEYNYYTNESQLNKADGVVIYIKEGIKEATNIENYGSLKTISTVISYGEQRLKISSLYRCKEINTSNFIKNIKSLIKNNKEHKNHIILGDTNINTLVENDITNEYLSNLTENGYLSYIKTITRPSVRNLNKGSCIDHIFARVDTKVKAFKVIESITDHYPTFLLVNKVKKESNNDYINIVNYNKLKKLCNYTNWNSIYDIDDANTATNYLVETIKNLVNIATKKRKLIKSKKKRKDWITNGLIISCNKKTKTI